MSNVTSEQSINATVNNLISVLKNTDKDIEAVDNFKNGLKVGDTSLVKTGLNTLRFDGVGLECGSPSTTLVSLTSEYNMLKLAQTKGSNTQNIIFSADKSLQIKPFEYSYSGGNVRLRLDQDNANKLSYFKSGLEFPDNTDGKEVFSGLKVWSDDYTSDTNTSKITLFTSTKMGNNSKQDIGLEISGEDVYINAKYGRYSLPQSLNANHRVLFSVGTDHIGVGNLYNIHYDNANLLHQVIDDINTNINNINTLLQSDDSTLDELQEIVDYIKANKQDLENLGISNIAGLQDALNNKLGKTENAVSASKLKTARTIALSGDASGSTNFDGSGNVTISVTVANDSHTHDGRYYTESESDNRFLGKTAKAADADKLDGLNSTDFVKQTEVTNTAISTSTIETWWG